MRGTVVMCIALIDVQPQSLGSILPRCNPMAKNCIHHSDIDHEFGACWLLLIFPQRGGQFHLPGRRQLETVEAKTYTVDVLCFESCIFHNGVPTCSQVVLRHNTACKQRPI
mmetsp:Transcript_8435/g.19951  ORF Transcript_8435/g.19951 Transcript_8435/m.19951 type:complete len:111 (-) Transcript_8435:314-646(-)